MRHTYQFLPRIKDVINDNCDSNRKMSTGNDLIRESENILQQKDVKFDVKEEEEKKKGKK